jgi:Pyruvate/2-oxoacid:ferredoxin oxidoreductase gamma subunit
MAQSGAPMTAYVRISKEAIFERGVIPAPDLVVVARITGVLRRLGARGSLAGNGQLTPVTSTVTGTG